MKHNDGDGGVGKSVGAWHSVAIGVALLVGAGLYACSLTQPDVAVERGSSATAMPFLRAQGRSVVNEQGSVVQLRGCNIGSWLVIEPWLIGWSMPNELQFEKAVWDILGRRFGEANKLNLIRQFRETFFTREDVRRIADTGMNCLRIPLWWRATDDPAYGGDIDYLDRCIRWCREFGVYAIIDLHGAPGGQSKWAFAGDPNNAELWKEDDRYRAQTVSWWTNIAARYRDEPAVAGYDLLNEANDAPVSLLMSFYDRLYKAVRAVDPRHLLIIEDGVHGFFRIPHPAQMGWSNVMYSFHYYAPTPLDGLEADAMTFLKYNRSAVYYDVPVLVGEFNSMDLQHGGADMFRRYTEVFDYYGWAWTFWTYKRVGDNADQLWGLYGYNNLYPNINLQTDSMEDIASSFKRMETSKTTVNPLLQFVLKHDLRRLKIPSDAKVKMLTPNDAYIMRQHPARVRIPWGAGVDNVIYRRDGRRIAWPFTVETNTTYELYLRPEHVKKDNGIRLEWAYDLPDIQYWGRQDRVAWPVSIDSGGTYELGLMVAHIRSDNEMEVWVDGVRVLKGVVKNPSRDWARYEARSLGLLDLKAGRHVIELARGNDAEPFVNLRYATLTPVAGKAAGLDEEGVRLDALTMDIPRTDSPLCIQWMDDPSAIGFWRSGEKATWNIVLQKGGRYTGRVTYASPNKDTVITVLVDGSPATRVKLPSTGDWWEFETVPVEALSLLPGSHEIALLWEGSNPDGCGNLSDVVFKRE